MTARSHSALRRTLGDIYYQRVNPVAARVAQLAPGRLVRQWKTNRGREAAESLFEEIATKREARIRGRVLVDGSFDNAHYWFRYSLLRAALGLANAGEIGILGQHRPKEAARTFQRIGVGRVLRWADLFPPEHRVRDEAMALLAQTSTPEDILNWELPFGFPALAMYDGILKRQHNPVVAIGHGRMESYVTEALQSLYAADALLRQEHFDLIALSHAVNYTFGAIAWRAAQLGVPVVVVSGAHGVNRFWRVEKEDDVLRQAPRPRPQDLERLPDGTAEALERIGEAYLVRRRYGGTNDLGAAYAYGRRPGRITREGIRRRFSWSDKNPIVAVYASNWFDFPHSEGMTQFRDFLDWLEVTVIEASRNQSVNWLFKGHPFDEYYGGVRMEDVFPYVDAPHVGIAPEDWNNADVLDSVDGLVTCSGTAGIEAAATQIPVLVADKGWYEDFGFVRTSRNRQHYLRSLNEAWWTDLDLEACSKRAMLFAGWYYGCPEWQDRFFTIDDEVPRYDLVAELITGNRGTMEREIEELRNWFESGERNFHEHKMARAGAYRLVEMPTIGTIAHGAPPGK